MLRPFGTASFNFENSRKCYRCLPPVKVSVAVPHMSRCIILSALQFGRCFIVHSRSQGILCRRAIRTEDSPASNEWNVVHSLKADRSIGSERTEVDPCSFCYRRTKDIRLHNVFQGKQARYVENENSGGRAPIPVMKRRVKQGRRIHTAQYCRNEAVSTSIIGSISVGERSARQIGTKDLIL